MKAFCKFIQITAVIAAGFCITGNAHASGRLVVTLSQPMQRQDAETGIVMIQMENTGDRPVAIFRWKTPFALYDDRLANPQFDVRDASGKMLPYKGRNVKPGPITPDSFIVLEPHQSIRKNVDVASDYGLDNGNYTVAFTIDLQVRPYAERIADTEATQLPINDQTVVSSNTLNIWVNPSLVNARKLTASIISTQGENCINAMPIRILNYLPFNGMLVSRLTPRTRS
jgi:hypothetical protein